MALIVGTPANDVTVGTVEADEMRGGLGNDRYNGGAGNDVMYGEEGNDTLTGDAGDDTLYGGVGNDGFFGGGGNDKIYGESGVDNMFGDGGNDVMDGGADNDTLNGGTGNDTLIHKLGEGTDTMIGGGGTDKVVIQLSASDLTAAVRADLVTLNNWMASQLTTAGSMAALAAQATGPSLTLAALGMTLSTFEEVSYVLDGKEVPLSALLNKAPEAEAAVNAAIDEDAVLEGSVAAIDPDGDVLGWSLVAGAANGTVTLDTATGKYTYTPAAHFSGVDQFSVAVKDPAGETVVQTINVTVSGIADAPVLSVVNPIVVTMEQFLKGLETNDQLDGTAGNDNISGGAGDDQIDGGGASMISVPVDVSAALVDLDGSETLSIVISGLPEGSTLSAGHDNGDGSWTLTRSELAGLTMTANVTGGFSLTIEATATEANGAVATSFAEIEIRVGDDNNVLSGGAGNDVIDGGHGDDIIFGGTPSTGTVEQPACVDRCRQRRHPRRRWQRYGLRQQRRRPDLGRQR